MKLKNKNKMNHNKVNMRIIVKIKVIMKHLLKIAKQQIKNHKKKIE